MMPLITHYSSVSHLTHVMDIITFCNTLSKHQTVNMKHNSYITGKHNFRNDSTFSFGKQAPGKVPPRKFAPRSGLGFGLGLVLELGSGGNFPRGQFS